MLPAENLHGSLTPVSFFVHGGSQEYGMSPLALWNKSNLSFILLKIVLDCTFILF